LWAVTLTAWPPPVFTAWPPSVAPLLETSPDAVAEPLALPPQAASAAAHSSQPAALAPWKNRAACKDFLV
jgi:hypothetical protein